MNNAVALLLIDTRDFPRVALRDCLEELVVAGYGPTRRSGVTTRRMGGYRGLAKMRYMRSAKIKKIQVQQEEQSIQSLEYTTYRQLNGGRQSNTIRESTSRLN